MKKFIFLLFLFYPILALFANGGLDRDKSAGVTPLPNLTPSLIYLEGSVTVNGEAAEEGQAVPVGSTIETGVSSYCEVLFAEKNIIRIQEQTITNLKIGPGQGKVEIEKGTMAFLLEKLDVLGLGDRDFEITTPLTTAGIRGTAFFFKVESPQSVYFCNCNGVINVSDIQGDNKQVLESGHHQALRYVKNDDRITQSQAGLLYHNDKDMDDLATKINHTISWGTPSYGSRY